MRASSVFHRLTASVALVGWLGLAGGGEIAELLSRALGLHDDCRMACCRETQATACARGASGAGHGAHRAAREQVDSAGDESIAARSGCEDACALLAEGKRAAPSPLGAVVATRLATSPTPVPTAPGPPTRLLLSSLSPRAPPA